MKNFKKIITQVTLLSLSLGLPTAAAVQSATAAVVSHNSIGALQSNKLNPRINNARPHFSFDDGCFSYPAADQQGNVNGGLKPGGKSGGDCRDSRFVQTYARETILDPKVFPGASTAVMYAQYFPKDQGNRPGIFGRIEGHRHDWEEVVVFLNKNGQAIKAAVSSHSNYLAINRNQGEFWDGNRVKVSYGSVIKNNSFRPSTKLSSGSPPIVDWATMTPAMRNGITTTNWGDASPKIINGTFQSKVTEAWNAK
jgi:hypothetical protein